MQACDILRLNFFLQWCLETAAIASIALLLLEHGDFLLRVEDFKVRCLAALSNRHNSHCLALFMQLNI